MNLDHLPVELKALDQWVICGYDKVPHLIRDNIKFKADPTNGPWMTFLEASTYAKKNRCFIGFVLTEHDPFCCIDMDVKDRTDLDDPLDSRKYARIDNLKDYAALVSGNEYTSSINSYCEFSANGLGIHAWVKHVIPPTSGMRNDTWEVYDRERFIICTGNEISKIDYMVQDGYVLAYNVVPVKELKRSRKIISAPHVNAILEDINGSVLPSTELVAREKEVSNEELLERLFNSANGEKFRNLYNYDLAALGITDASIAYHSFIEFLAFATPSNQQVWEILEGSRMFHRPGEPDHHKQNKHKSEKHFRRSLGKLRAIIDRENEARESIKQSESHIMALSCIDSLLNKHIEKISAVDISAIVALDERQRMEEANEIIDPIVELNLDTPTTLAQEPPGVVGELYRHILRNLSLPVEEVALVAAIGFFAGIAGLVYRTPTSTGTNVYLTLLGASGIGKEGYKKALSNVCRELILSNASLEPILNTSIVRADLSSDSALRKFIATNRQFLHIVDEGGHAMAARSRGMVSPHELKLDREILSLYDDSGINVLNKSKLYSDQTQNVHIEGGVSYSRITESTPDKFLDNLTSDMFEDGMISRQIIMRCKDYRHPFTIRNTPMPAILLNRLAMLVQECGIKLASANYHDSVLDDEARIYADDLSKSIDDKLNSAIYRDNNPKRHVLTRYYLNVLKIATILAIADKEFVPSDNIGDFAVPVVRKGHLEWACYFLDLHVNFVSTAIDSGDVSVGNVSWDRLEIVSKTIRKFLNGKSGDPKLKLNNCFRASEIRQRLRQSKLFRDETSRTGIDLMNYAFKVLENDGFIRRLDKFELSEFKLSGEIYKVIMLTSSYENTAT